MFKKIFNLLKSNFVIPERLNRVHFINRSIMSFIVIGFIPSLIISIIYYILIYMYPFLEHSPLYKSASMMLVVALGISIVIQNLRLQVARLHDLNLSGWFSLLIFIPFITVIYCIYIYVIPGTMGVNNFGIQPKKRSKIETILSFVFGIFSVSLPIKISSILIH